MSHTRLRWIYVLVDLLSTSAAWFCFNMWRFAALCVDDDITFAGYYSWQSVWGGQIFFPLMMLGIYWLSGYYNVESVSNRSRAQEFLTTLASVCAGAIAIFFLAIVNDLVQRRLIAIENLAVIAGLLFAWVYIGRILITRIWVRRTHLRRYYSEALMIGTDDHARRLAHRINSLPKGMGLQVCDFVCPQTESVAEICHSRGIRHIIVSPLIADSPAMPALLNELLPLDVSVYISPGIHNLPATSHRIGNVVGEPLVDLSHPNISAFTVNLKRLSDVIGASVALAALWPLMLIVAVAIKCDSRGPVLYRQERIGRRKHPFYILKFRSMVNDAETLSGGPMLSYEHDPRVTRVGRVLRKYRLDELPQFWNVLRGDMSLVGPRPERRYFADLIAEREPLYSMIYQVRPGITSWGMVKYGYASTVDEMVERLRYDLIYMENISLTTDIKILIYTVNTVLSGRGK